MHLAGSGGEDVGGALGFPADPSAHSPGASRNPQPSTGGRRYVDDLADTVDTYERVAEKYRERHADRSVVADLVDRFLEALAEAGHHRGARIVDAGCGPGWETATFEKRGHEPVGIDLAPAFLGATKENTGGDLARMDMRELGIATDAVHGVWACASFLHVPREDAPGALAEFRRVLRSGGVLQLVVKCGEGTKAGDGYEDDEREFTLYRPAEIRELVGEAGFAVRRVEEDESEGGQGWIAVTAGG
jgi:SAM-dependent methyltransferase